VDLGNGKNRLGGSILAQVYNQMGDVPADLDSAPQLKAFFTAMQASLAANELLAYHDRSDGGLLTTVVEMAFAGHTGVNVNLDGLGDDALAILFSEEAGAVVQVSRAHSAAVQTRFANAGLRVNVIGSLNNSDSVQISQGGKVLFNQPRTQLQSLWSETSYRIQALRDNPACAQQEFETITKPNPGLSAKLTYDPNQDIAAPFINTGVRPSIAVLREQGVNGHVEMAAAFDRAGFTAVDVHMSDLLSGRVSLQTFKGLVACGGFSYGDVLGAGEGWSKTILFNNKVRDEFERFFHRNDTFSLGICNGCQMMSNLKNLIPGADHWPRFVRNLSEQFEARVALVNVQESSSVLFSGMVGSHMPVAVAHGEGYAEFASAEALKRCNDSGTVAMRFIDNHLNATEAYPANPNGSPLGITSVASVDGRVTIMMPHPERVFRAVTNSWKPDDWKDDGAWMRLFRNARVFVG
jgi:phosphoribosylformylglycinamidine synthase